MQMEYVRQRFPTHLDTSFHVTYLLLAAGSCVERQVYIVTKIGQKRHVYQRGVDKAAPFPQTQCAFEREYFQFLTYHQNDLQPHHQRSN